MPSILRGWVRSLAESQAKKKTISTSATKLLRRKETTPKQQPFAFSPPRAEMSRRRGGKWFPSCHRQQEIHYLETTEIGCVSSVAKQIRNDSIAGGSVYIAGVPRQKYRLWQVNGDCDIPYPCK